MAQTIFFTLCSFAVLLSVYEWLMSDDKINYIIRNCTTYVALLSFYLVATTIVWLWKRITFDWGCIGIALNVLLAALVFDWLTFLAEKLIINLGVIGMAAMVLIQLFFDRDTVKRAIHYRKDNPYPPEKKIAG